MGELIYCSRPIAANPYYLEELSVNIYSLEEMSYFIFHNVYLINSDFMSIDLTRWIGRELDLKELSESLYSMITDNAPLHLFIGTILRESGYLSSGEIRDTLDIISAFENKSDAERKKIRADRFMDKGRTMEAIYEYEDLLSSEDNIGDRLLGDVWHNLGSAYAKLFFLHEAGECFIRAYKKNHRRQSLRSLMYTYLLMGDKAGLEKQITYFQIPEQERELVQNEVQHVLEADKIKSFNEEVDRMRSSYSEQSAYRGALKNIIDGWKSEYV